MRRLYQAQAHGHTVTAVTPQDCIRVMRDWCHDMGKPCPGLRIKPVRA